MNLEQLLVVINQGNNRIFGANIIHRVCGHRMMEVKVKPLTHIEFILIVAKGDSLN